MAMVTVDIEVATHEEIAVMVMAVVMAVEVVAAGDSTATDLEVRSVVGRFCLITAGNKPTLLYTTPGWICPSLCVDVISCFEQTAVLLWFWQINDNLCD